MWGDILKYHVQVSSLERSLTKLIRTNLEGHIWGKKAKTLKEARKCLERGGGDTGWPSLGDQRGKNIRPIGGTVSSDAPGRSGEREPGKDPLELAQRRPLWPLRGSYPISRACLCRAEVGRYVGRYATDSNHLLEMFDDKGEENPTVAWGNSDRESFKSRLTLTLLAPDDTSTWVSLATADLSGAI